MDAVAEEIGPNVRVATVDTSAEGSVAALAESLAGEQVSILVNNAGVAGPVAPLTDVSVDDWDEVFAVNVRGVFLMCRAFLPPMVARGEGDIINLASVSGKRPLARRTPYTASKMAVIGLTTTLAHEVGHLGVAVNSLSPGPVSGPRMERNFAREAARAGTTPAAAEAEFVGRSALKRMVTEAEVAAAVLGDAGHARTHRGRHRPLGRDGRAMTAIPGHRLHNDFATPLWVWPSTGSVCVCT